MAQGEYLVTVEESGPCFGGGVRTGTSGHWGAGETEDEVPGLVAETIRLYLEELERDDSVAAESVVDHTPVRFDHRCRPFASDPSIRTIA